MIPQLQRTLTISALAGAIALAGCVHADPLGQDHDQTAQGAVTGGLIGAGIGALVDPRHAATGAAIGGIIGVVTGASAGAGVDRYEAAVRAHLRHEGILVERHGREIVLVMPDDVLFQTGSAHLTRRAVHTLEAVAAAVRARRQDYVDINGYTDTMGSADDNMHLSQARADSVADALEHMGVSGMRITAKGFGESHPKVQTGANVSEPRNRRVEIVLEPIVG